MAEKIFLLAGLYFLQFPFSKSKTFDYQKMFFFEHRNLVKRSVLFEIQRVMFARELDAYGVWKWKMNTLCYPWVVVTRVRTTVQKKEFYYSSCNNHLTFFLIFHQHYCCCQLTVNFSNFKRASFFQFWELFASRVPGGGVSYISLFQ